MRVHPSPQHNPLGAEVSMSIHTEHTHVESQEPNVRFIHHVVHDSPGKVVSVCLVVSLVLIAVPWVVAPLEFSEIGSFYARSDRVAEEYDAFRSLDQFKQEEQSGNDVQAQQSQPLGGVSLIYMVPETTEGNRNIFTAARLDKIRALEARLQAVQEWTGTCLRASGSNVSTTTTATACAKPISPVESLGFYDANGTQVDVQARLQMLASLSDAQLDAQGASFFFDTSFGSGSAQSLYTRSQFVFGGPLKGYKNVVDQRKAIEQRTKLEPIGRRWHAILSPYRNDSTDSKGDPDLQVLYMGDHVTDLQIDHIVTTDLTLFSLAVVLVLSIIVVHTGSQFLGIMSILHIVGSALVALSFYRIFYSVMTQQNLLALFVVLGIGANDVFVYKDAWMQSYQAGAHANANMLNRIAWTWNRSVTAMLTTSLTSAAAFMSTVFNPIPSIRVLGVYTAMCILVNFALVITYFPAVVVLWSRKGWDSQCCGKEREGPEERATRLKNVPEHELDKEAAYDMPAQCGGATQRHTQKRVVRESRRIEQFFHGTYTPWLYRSRWAVVAVSLALVVAGTVLASTIQVNDSDEDPFFPREFFTSVFARIMSKGFRLSSQSEVVQVNTVYGVAGIDRSGIDPNDQELLGTPVFQTQAKFALQSPASQLEVLKTCTEGAKLTMVRQGQVECFMEDFRTFVQASNGTFPVPENAFVARLQAFLNDNKWSNVHGKNVDVKDGRVRFAVVRFNTTMPLQPSFSRKQQEYALWSTFQDARNADARETANAYQTSSVWSSMRTQEVLVENALVGALVSLALAFVVLTVVSSNVIIAVLATVSIACVLVCILGFIPLAGFTLGFMESICITVLVGLSVDFVVHLAIAYRDSPRVTRYERVQDAFTELGVSIVGGALTTVSTTTTLFFTTVVLLLRFGQIILVAIALSFFFANGLFMALMLMVGPEGDAGELKPLFRRLVGSRGEQHRRRSKHVQEGEA